MTDQVYLIGTLATHRRGRLLMQLLDAAAIDLQSDGLPESGICLFFGKEYQQAESEIQRMWQQWCERPGRTLLLIPPFTEGSILKIDEGVDWSSGFCGDGIKGLKGTVAELVAGEVVFCLQSKHAVFDYEAGHQWQDYSFNTLFNKRHSASGLFAATTLPIWSISLLDFQKELLHFLDMLHDHAGAAMPETIEEVEGKCDQPALENEDYTVLACVYAYGKTNTMALLKKISDQTFPLFSFDPDWLKESLKRLSDLGYVQEEGITGLGLATLQEGPWCQYALRMKEEA
jgi:hypothetical protein